MRDYEVVYIFNSELEDEDVESRLDSYHERLTDDGSGEVTAVEDWGKRQLAYPIEDQENGRYVVAQFSIEPEALDEFERVLKLDGDLLRHLVVLHEGELPTPPSARRPGAGPDEGDEEEEAEEAEEETAGEAEEPEEEEDEEGEEPEDESESDEPGADEEDEEEADGDEEDEEEDEEAGEEDEDDEDEEEGSDDDEEKE
ncbi:MAG: 30S ribosomal protein S6 [Candidatus Palauibacterales bacterium]|nr:30S ribosomal protein S6 [Candidatus Palauibacterales bacterium]